MRALSLDTATEVLSLCARNGDAWASVAVRQGLRHSPALLPLAQRLVADLGMGVEDLELVVCTVGPGSFTGIRIGISTALGIGKGRGIPVAGVPTLDAMARAWSACPADIFPVVDARRGNIYTACFRGGARQGDYLDLSPVELASRLAASKSPLLVGPDAPAIARLLGGEATAGVGVSDATDPRMALELGIELVSSRGVDAVVPKPLYLRKSEAERLSGR
jgi:tRNA threonylcarbamoyladenosine biosynthesis protein TsaB